MLLAAAIAASVPGAIAVSEPMPVPEGVEQRPLTLERIFGDPDLSGPAPREAKLSPDGSLLTLLRNREDDADRYDLWALDIASGEWRMLVDSLAIGSGAALSEAERMQRERERIGNITGIASYEWTPDGQAVLVPLDGDLYLARIDGSVERLTESEAGELNPAISPDGGYVSFVRDQRLWVGALGETPQAVTPGGGTVHYGEAEFVAQEEMDRHTGYWWSPQDRRIAVEWYDESNVALVTRTAIGAGDVTTIEQRYPLAGTANIVPHLIVIDPDGGNSIEVDLGEETDIYLARVDWAPDGETLYVQRQNRAQTQLDMLAVDPATGASRILFSEDEGEGRWVDLSNNYRFLEDGRLVWWSQRSGFSHYYLYQDGAFTPLTSGDWEAQRLIGIDEEAGLLFFEGLRDGPLAVQGYRVSLDGSGEITRLTDPAYTHHLTMDDSGQRLLVTRESHNQPPQTYLADADGNRLAWIEENAIDADHPYAPHAASHAQVTYGTLESEDGATLYWRMVTPPMEPGRRYPVIYYHYGGPAGQVVTNAWRSGSYRYPEQLAVDRGYIWFSLDNRGTPGRGIDFITPTYQAGGGIEVQDHAEGAAFLRSLDFVDPDRVGIGGWSYGGYMTLKILVANPGLYAAGFAGAPVAKWELYDTHYTERYMGDPRLVPEAYEAASALNGVERIADPMLLIHGMSDDNVVFDNSVAVAAALQEAAVPFEMMFYPGQTHRFTGQGVRTHLWGTIFDFFERNGVTGGPR